MSYICEHYRRPGYAKIHLRFTECADGHGQPTKEAAKAALELEVLDQIDLLKRVAVLLNSDQDAESTSMMFGEYRKPC